MAKRTFSSFEYGGISFLLNTSILGPCKCNRAHALKKIKAQKILRGLGSVAGVYRLLFPQ